METVQSLGLAGLITTLATITAYLIKLNHKRIRSKCCNKDCTTSLDVEDTTPQKDLKITIPA
jgi:hypothetical protein